MSVSLPPLQAFPPGLAIFIAVSAAAAAWVAQDARARFAGGPGEGWVWAIGTLVALPIFLPLYLIAARPVGSVAVCPSCGRRTIGHRAACLHCGHPITFEAFPDTWGWGEVVGIAVVFMISLPVIAQAIGAEAMAAAEHANDVLTRLLGTGLSTPALVWILILVGVIVPVGEEVFFRGFVYGTLRRWGVLPGALLSAVYFGAVHQQIVHFLPITVLGIVLALLYERTGSLVSSMAVHGINNVVAILSILYGWNI